MTREQLRQHYITQGWNVPAVEDWKLVSAVGLEPKKYDIDKVFNPKTENYTTATVVVYGEGSAEEKAVGQNDWKQSFRDELNTYVRSMEQGSVWGITVNEVHEQDLMAYVTAIIQAAGKGTAKRFFIRKRDNAFSYIEEV